MNHLLSEAEEPIRQALERLIAKDIDKRPFVIVSEVGRPDVFVQFAMRVRDRVLCFDVPRLGIVTDPTEGPVDAAGRAFTTLVGSFGVPLDVRVLVLEEEGGSGGRGVPFWKRPWLRSA